MNFLNVSESLRLTQNMNFSWSVWFIICCSFRSRLFFARVNFWRSTYEV